ncbi:MAG: site-specific integrase [Nanoarchaeota archaeon]|nr:site-specific integrase [Nanoarchaeota archaeon]
MKYLNILDNFEQNLNRNPELMLGTVKAYVKIMRELVNKYGIDPNIDQLNEFIAYKCKKRQPLAKYALKHYLHFRWRNEVYYKLVKAKVKKPSMKKNFVKKEDAKKIINNIKNPKYRLIAKIQYLTGSRASEVISIEKKYITLENKYNRIRIDIKGKGDKIDPIYLDVCYFLEINEYIRQKGNFLFFNELMDTLEEKKQMIKLESLYKRYYETLKNSSKDYDIRMGTHDWRRSFAQSLRESGVDILEIKKALRHENIETTERYFKDDPESIAKTMLTHQQGI